MAQNIEYDDIRAGVQGLDPASAVEVAQIAQLAVRKAGQEGRNFDGSASVGFGPAATKAKFFASLPNGEKFRAGKALAAVPAWAAGVQIAAGYVCQNAGNMYWLLGTLVGGASLPTSGVVTVTAPTGTGSAVIPTATDNLRWLYLGPYTPDVLAPNQIDTPAFSFGALPAAATRRYNPNVAADLAAFYVTGSAYNLNANEPGGTYKGINALSTQNPNTFCVDFITDSPILMLQRYGQFGTQAMGVSINATPLWHKLGTGHLYPSPTNNFGAIFDWTAEPSRERRIRFYPGNATFTGAYIDPQYSVWAPINPGRYRLYVEGDSITQLAQPGNGGWRASHRIAANLGCDDVWDSAAGGTGFINSGGGPNLIARIPKVIAAAPDILYVRPINNDVGNDATYNSATRIAAYQNYFTQLLTALPNLIIICGGGFATGGANLVTTVSSAWQVEQDMETAIAQFGSPQVRFLPTISDPAGRWLFGDGHTGTTGNSTHGNSDLFIGDGSDTLHPNVRYYESICRREVNGLIGIMNSLAF